jgi:pyrroline-5-carboxylate reductase
VSAFPASIWLVGAGNMGGAMLRRWIDAGADPASITVIDPFASDVPAGVTLLREVPPEGSPEVLVLAVKPQMLDAMPRIAAGVLVSILAGVEEATLAARFDVGAVVRAMPNLPVSLGQGVVALHTDSPDPAVRATAETLMAPLGLVEWVEREELFHAVTALSGSGPGFVYRFIESLADAGTALGLPADQALRFAIATVEGSAALAGQAGESPSVLADRVASPKGTTREGLDVLDKDEAMKRLIHDTLAAAARRSAELAEAARAS